MMEKLPLPASGSVAEVAGGIHMAILIFGEELGSRVNEGLRNKYPNWFTMLQEARRNQRKPVYDSFLDARFLLSELKAEDQLIAGEIPGFNDQWLDFGMAVKKAANRWSHMTLAPTLDTYCILVGGLAKLADLSQLDVAKRLNEAVDRATEILEGKYKPFDHAGAADNSAGTEVEKKVREIFDRPPIGGRWHGPLGTRPIKISHTTRDVTERGESIKSELGPNADEKISDWLSYYPKHLTGEAAVAEDGAVMAFVKGLPYLIGYLGDEPKAISTSEIDTPLRGFALDYQYVFVGDDVRETTTNKRLGAVAPESTARLISTLAAALKPDTLFSATEYGELFTEDEDGQVTLITTVQKSNWFPGHLPELT